MREVIQKEKRAWTAPTRKLTREEIEELVETYDYDPEYENDETREPEPIYDKFGNPSRETIAAMYEERHGLCEVMTLEEFHDWMRELYEETECAK